MTESIAVATNRRREVRRSCALPIFVRSLTEHAHAIKTYTLTDNISSGGFYFQVPYLLKVGAWLFSLIQLPNGVRLAVRGLIVRSELLEHGLFGVGVCFHQVRMLPVGGSES